MPRRIRRGFGLYVPQSKLVRSGFECHSVRRAEETLEVLGVFRMGRNEKMPPPSLLMTTRTKGLRSVRASASEFMSCSAARSPMIAVTGTPSAAPWPMVVAMLPSMPLAPRLTLREAQSL